MRLKRLPAVTPEALLIFGSIVYFVTVYGLIICLSAPLPKWALGKPRLAWIMRWWIISVPFLWALVTYIYNRHRGGRR